MNKKTKIIISSILLLTLVYLGLIFTGYKQFIIWYQVTKHKTEIITTNPHYYCSNSLEESIRKSHKLGIINKQDSSYQQNLEKCINQLNETLEKYSPEKTPFLEKASHFIRSWLLYPLVYMGYYFNISMHMIFSVLCLLLIFTMCWLIDSISKHTGLLNKLVLSSTYLFLSIFMNGRMILIFFALNMFIWLTNYNNFNLNNKKDIAIYLLSLFSIFLISNVSSSANLILFIFFLVYLIKNFNNFKNLKVLIPIFLLMIVHFLFTFAGVAKNLAFYGNDIFSIFRVINHGLGEFLIAKIIFVVLTFLLIFRFRKLQISNINLNILYALTCTCGVFFGYALFFFSIPFYLFLLTNSKIYTEIYHYITSKEGKLS